MAEDSRQDFFTWFDHAEDTSSAFIRGQWDFYFHILQPAASLIAAPEEKSILEIGYGGGRMLAAASRSFKNAIGIDVHDQHRLVLSELRKRGVTNVNLYSTNGNSIPVPEASIDLVYSFIVLQHVGKVSVFADYLQETYRVLKPGGLAILYFGRKSSFSLNKRSRYLLWLDFLFERMWLPAGYLELKADVSHTNLLLTRQFAKRRATSKGFSFIKFLVSHKRVPDGYGRFGGQHGIVLQK